MALSKKIVKDNGITTSYHKVTTVTISQKPYLLPEADDNIYMSVELTSYFNEEYRHNSTPIESNMYYFNITSEEEESTSARKLAYSKIKTLDMWADATDC